MSEGRLGASYWKLFAATTISNLGDGIGLIAYPWLATAVTRDPLLVAGVAVAQRVPWLVFSLPAGVITDRVDRRTLMVRANVVRAIITVFVAVMVFTQRSALPGPDEVDAADAVATTNVGLYSVIVAATLLLGVAEVLYDNAGQTIMPTLVERPLLERANGRLWSAEQVANTFVGPPIAAALLAIAFFTPFAVDAATFAASAVLISLIPPTVRSSVATVGRDRWTTELRAGVRWLWEHEFLRRLAIILGLLNMLATMTLAVFVLWAQEVLGTSTAEFAILSTGAAVGGILGGWLGSSVSDQLGPGPSLAATLVMSAVSSLVIGLTDRWPVAWAMLGAFTFFGVVWNVITVSLRQTIIPDELLGRVNSVYRFFAWGMMPIGALAGGGLVSALDGVTSRDVALRSPWFASAAASVVLAVYAIPKLTTTRIEAARAAAD